MQSGIDSSRAALADSATRITISPAARGRDAFLGEDGLSLRDVVDAVNPLNHIPFISTLFNEATDHTPSTLSRLVGGTLIGGPIGFIASLANVIFEQETGKPIGETMLAALTGDENSSATQLASVTPGQEILPPESVAHQNTKAPLILASIAPAAGVASPINSRDATILDLYGGSAASAHRSYNAAQMRPYLQDVTQSQVL